MSVDLSVFFNYAAELAPKKGLVRWRIHTLFELKKSAMQKKPPEIRLFYSLTMQ